MRRDDVRKGRGWGRAGLLLLAVMLLGGMGCSALADNTLRAGLGASCVADADCQQAVCLSSSELPVGTGGVCASKCGSAGDCPAGTRCAAGYCRPPLSVGAIFVGSPSDLDGWTTVHDAGLRGAASALGYVDIDVRYGVLPGTAAPLLAGLVPTARLIAVNGIDYEEDVRISAQQNSTVKYLMADNNIYLRGNDNITPFGIYLDEGYYLAGRIAAQFATNRLGFIAGFIGPETVRNINAFTRGARSVKPGLVVEVRFVGFFNDLNTVPTQTYHGAAGDKLYFREQLLTRLLIDSGCEVIAHYTNTQRSVRLVHDLEQAGELTPGSVYTVAQGTRTACRAGDGTNIPSCIGAVYTDWTRIYRSAMDARARNALNSLQPLRGSIDDTDSSQVGFVANPAGRGVDTVSVAAENQVLARRTNPGPHSFISLGPYALNGQRDSDNDGIPDAADRQQIKAGEFLSEAEDARACFFVAGVVEKSTPDDPGSADVAALVPGGLLPGATAAGSAAVLRAGQSNALTVPTGVQIDCRKNAPMHD